MKKNYWHKLLILLSLVLTNPAFAWWDLGHMVVAQIAYQELRPEVQEKVDEYITAVSNDFPNHSDFITASLWADDIIHDGLAKVYFGWHGSARPYDPEKILSSEKLENILTSFKNNDSVWAIKQCIDTLKNPEATKWAKGFMLRMLIHVVGDIHQPLHCVTYYSSKFPKGDKAGTQFPINYKEYKSLHSIFDGSFGLTERKVERPVPKDDRQYVGKLATSLKEKYPHSTFNEQIVNDDDECYDSWRKESYEIGVNFAYDKFLAIAADGLVSDELVEEGQEVTGARLALAGYRLAHLLNKIYP